jgi:hypothetical protein
MTTIVEPGEKIHIITRRLFDEDIRRHFAGLIEKVSSTVIQVRGYAYVYDEWANQFKILSDERVRLFSLTDAGLIINILPRDVEVADLKYTLTADGQRILSDGKDFSLDVSEFTSKR